MKKKLYFIHFQVLVEKIIKENGKNKIILECLGKYKDTIKDAIKKNKDDFISFENQTRNSTFFNDVKDSKYKKLEDCLEVVYTKITGKPIQQYNNEEKKIKNFIDNIFNSSNHHNMIF